MADESDNPGPLLEIEGLRKRFGDNEVLAGVDLAVPEAAVTTVIGKSGIGKSVLLKCVAGLLDCDEGELRFRGEKVGRGGLAARGASGEFSYMFQHNALFDALTVEENVALPLRETGRMKRPEIRRRARAILERLELSEAARRHPGEISGGMRKRVALARALVTEPRLVLFDEPTTGLDPERKFAVFDMIARYRADFGFTALMVSHDIPEVFEISDRVAWLDEGRVRFSGAPSEIDATVERGLADFLRRPEWGQAGASRGARKTKEPTS